MRKPPEMKNFGLLIACVHLTLISWGNAAQLNQEYGCPSQDKILPCRCSTRDMEFQIWCSHSELPRVLEGLEAVSHYIARPVDEVILENNNLPSLPGKTFTNLKVLRLMLRNNRLERVSAGWLEGLHDSLLELFIVEPDLRSLPVDSLENLLHLEAVTLQSRTMKRLPKFSGLPMLRYLQVNSPSLLELTPRNFRSLPSLTQLHIFGSDKLERLDSGLFQDLSSLNLINITDCGINWIHPRAIVNLPELREVSLVGNFIDDAAMVGRAVIDLPSLSILRLDRNRIGNLNAASFVDLPMLSELYLSRNRIAEIYPQAFHRVPLLRAIDLNHNMIHRIYPYFFPQGTGNGLEELWLINNDVSRVSELRSILDTLPRLNFLDLSHNYLEEIPSGVIRGHPMLERLHLDHNRINVIEVEAFTAMPALRELRLRNNSLSNLLKGPLWNLPALKGLDLAGNYFQRLEPRLLANLPNLRRLDFSENAIRSVDPASFLANPALEHVNLSGNALSNLHPRTFRHLGSLYELDVGWNRLTEVVAGLPPSIEHLHIPMNQVSILPMPESLDLALPALRVLDLSANGIKRLFPRSLSTLPSLTKLKLGYNSLQDLENGCFDRLSRLEQLDLRNNRLVSLHGNCFHDLRMLLDLNLKNNRLELLRPDLFENNVRLQKLDLSMNRLERIPHAIFSNTRDLREVYTSHNALTELPRSLHDLTSLQVLDLSFNKLNILSPETLTSLTSLLELRLVRNKIQELREGAFQRLPSLTLIDLESNDLRVIERNAVRGLPKLQALRMGSNKLKVIPNGAFTELPVLQSAELQNNRIEEISSNAFINVPQLLFLNLSHNAIPGLEHAGLESLNSLEVLDVSNNHVTRVSTESLAAMEWLVELKLDNNDICTIHGSPFDDMPRLRVLSLRHNRMTSVSENTFRRLRSNIAVLDIDGNPLSCSCGMLWLRGWLQQESTEGPRCADGTLFREIRLSRQDCQREKQIEPTVPGCDAEIIDGASLFGTSQVTSSWANSKDTTASRPLPNDSEYFYDDYVDYPYDIANMNMRDNSSTISTTLPTIKESMDIQATTNSPSQPTGGTPTIYAATNAVNRKNKTVPVPSKDVPPSPSSSGFTFFGVPLPSLNFNLWGNSRKNADRKSDFSGRPGSGRGQMFPPTEPEIHRGGFVPLPQGETGFVPIIDPHLRYQMEMNRSSFQSNKNVASRHVNNTVGSNSSTIIASNFVKTSNRSQGSVVSIEKSSLQKNPTRSKEESTRPKISSVSRKFEQQSNSTTSPATGFNDSKNITNVVSKTVESIVAKKVIEQSKSDQASIPMEIQETKLHDDVSTWTERSHREVASKIVWTTPRSQMKVQRVTTTGKEVEPTTTKPSNISEIIEQTGGNRIIGDWMNPEITIQHRSTTTTPTSHSPTSVHDLDSPTTTTQPQLMPTTMIDLEVTRPMLSVTHVSEASSLSALLVPGGQVPPHQPLGRSTITKVTAPGHESATEQHHYETRISDYDEFSTKLPKNLANEMLIKSDTTTEQANFYDSNGKILNDSAFNWYFQHYSDTNLEPYVRLADNSVEQRNIVRIYLYIVCFVLRRLV